MRTSPRVSVHVTPESMPSSSAIHTSPAEPGKPSSVLGLELDVDLGFIAPNNVNNVNMEYPSTHAAVPNVSVDTPSSCADWSTGWDPSLLAFDWSNNLVMQPASHERTARINFDSCLMEDRMRLRPMNVPIFLPYFLDSSGRSSADGSCGETERAPNIEET